MDFAHKARNRNLVAEDKKGELNREEDDEFSLTRPGLEGLLKVGAGDREDLKLLRCWEACGEGGQRKEAEMHGLVSIVQTEEKRILAFLCRGPTECLMEYLSPWMSRVSFRFGGHSSKADVIFIARQAPHSRLLSVPVVRCPATRDFPNLGKSLQAMALVTIGL